MKTILIVARAFKYFSETTQHPDGWEMDLALRHFVIDMPIGAQVVEDLCQAMHTDLQKLGYREISWFGEPALRYVDDVSLLMIYSNRKAHFDAFPNWDETSVTGNKMRVIRMGKKGGGGSGDNVKDNKRR